MEEKKTFNLWVGVLLASFVIASLHSFFYLFYYKTGGQPQPSISGMTIGGDSIIDSYKRLPLISKIIIGAEWLLVVGILINVLIKGKRRFQKERSQITTTTKSRYKKIKPQTDLDILYGMIKEKKALRIETITKLFDINKETAMIWGKILESGDLAEIKYPTVGGPKLVLFGEEEEKKKRKEQEKQRKKKLKDEAKMEKTKLSEDKIKNKVKNNLRKAPHKKIKKKTKRKKERKSLGKKGSKKHIEKITKPKRINRAEVNLREHLDKRNVGSGERIGMIAKSKRK